MFYFFLTLFHYAHIIVFYCLPRLALLFAGGVIFVYLMQEIKMLLLLLLFYARYTEEIFSS